MKSILISFLTLTIISFTSCMNNSGSGSNMESDTTKAIEVAVRTAMQSNRTDFDSLRKQYQAGDTIFFTTDSLPLADLPDRVDSMTLRIVGHEQLCAADTISNQSADYLYIRAFAKNDTGYYVSVQRLNCQRASNGEAMGVFIAKRKTKGHR